MLVNKRENISCKSTQRENVKTQNYLPQIIVRQRFVEHGGQVGVSAVQLADSPCTVPLSLDGITLYVKSQVVSSIRL